MDQFTTGYDSSKNSIHVRGVTNSKSKQGLINFLRTKEPISVTSGKWDSK